jgi:hypothetical protein
MIYKSIGCRAVGFNVLMSAFIGLLVNLVMSYPTLPVSEPSEIGFSNLSPQPV